MSFVKATQMVMVYITVDSNVRSVGKMVVKQKKSTAVAQQQKSSAAMNLQAISAQFSKLSGAYLGAGLWGLIPPPITKGAPKSEKGKKKEKWKGGGQEIEKNRRVNHHNERGAIKRKEGFKERKLQGCQIAGVVRAASLLQGAKIIDSLGPPEYAPGCDLCLHFMHWGKTIINRVFTPLNSVVKKGRYLWSLQLLSPALKKQQLFDISFPRLP